MKDNSLGFQAFLFQTSAYYHAPKHSFDAKTGNGSWKPQLAAENCTKAQILRCALLGWFTSILAASTRLPAHTAHRQVKNAEHRWWLHIAPDKF